jgi:hypothetical protein
LFLVPAVAAYLIARAYLRPALPDSIVGKWRIEGGDMDGARISFAPNGDFKAILDVDGRAVAVDASVAKQGDTLRYAIVNPQTGRTETKVQTITSLCERAMVVEENGQRSRLVRISSSQ